MPSLTLNAVVQIIGLMAGSFTQGEIKHYFVTLQVCESALQLPTVGPTV